MQNSLENLASHAIAFKSLLWYPYVTITWNIYYSSIVRLLLGNCSKPAHLRWNQFRHIWPYHHMFLASDKCKTVQSPYRGSRSGNEPALVCGKGIIVSFENISTHAVSSWKGRNSVLLHYALLTWCDPRISDVGGSCYIGAEWKLHYITLTPYCKWHRGTNRRWTYEMPSVARIKGLFKHIATLLIQGQNKGLIQWQNSMCKSPLVFAHIRQYSALVFRSS